MGREEKKEEEDLEVVVEVLQRGMLGMSQVQKTVGWVERAVRASLVVASLCCLRRGGAVASAFLDAARETSTSSSRLCKTARSAAGRNGSMGTAVGSIVPPGRL